MLSAADSELAALGSAYAKLPAGFPTVRLTNLLALGHPASVDLYVERTLRHAKIVVLRMLGGEANAAANYTAPPADGSRPGIVQIPLRPDVPRPAKVKAAPTDFRAMKVDWQDAAKDYDARFDQLQALFGQ